MQIILKPTESRKLNLLQYYLLGFAVWLFITPLLLLNIFVVLYTCRRNWPNMGYLRRKQTYSMFLFCVTEYGIMSLFFEHVYKNSLIHQAEKNLCKKIRK